MTIGVNGDKEERAALFTAVSKVMEDIGTVSRDNKATARGGREYKYADLTAVLEAIRPHLPSHGLWYTQNPGKLSVLPIGSGLLIQTIDSMVSHAGGGYVQYETDIPVTQNTEQGMGIGTSYGRRYQSVSNWSVGMEDNDGQVPAAKARPSDQGNQPAPADNSVSRPAQSATGASSRTPFTAKELRGTVASKSFPSMGIIGAYLTDNPKSTAPTDEALAEYQEANPGITMAKLLPNAANWFVENGPDGEMKDRVLAWLGENE